ncbi:hypothetical protein ONZ45_g7621 [Pleurotus djamor]|nr:hypothetical protein ONZ45_g7621 [Pleurotus djamor]
MKRLDRGDSIQYAILVGNIWYETIRVLSDFRAESIRGRCTRVWEVFEQRAPEGPTYALKAAWVDRRNHSEGELYLELMERMKTKQDPHATEDILQNHFLRLKGFSPTDQSVTTCQYLGLKELSLGDSIRTFQSNVTGPPLNISPIPRGETRRPYYYNSSGNIISGGLDGHIRDFHLVRPGEEDQYIPRRLDRSVWLDVGTAFDQCMSLREIFKYIRQVVQALRAMWLGAFAIHRDISPGNIIICDGHARLSDFEFVTFYDPNQASEAGRIKTGTAQFMSIEVFNGSYEFRTQKPIMTHRSKSKATLYGAEYNEAPFMHNPFHDLESIWWLLVWTLLRLSPSQSTNLYDVAILEKKAEIFQVLFLPPFNLRHLAFKDPRFFADRLPTSSFPDTSLEVSCSDLAQFLYSHYQRVEASIPIAAETFGDMFPVFLDYIQDMDEDSQDHDSLIKVLDVYGTLKIKRSLETSDSPYAIKAHERNMIIKTVLS